MSRVRLFTVAILAIIVCTPQFVFAQSGKISGVVRSAATGEPLIGVNVLVDGTQQGAVTDVEGHYFILRLRPGTYTVKYSYISHTPQTVENIEIRSGLTSEMNVYLEEEADWA